MFCMPQLFILHLVYYAFSILLCVYCMYLEYVHVWLICMGIYVYACVQRPGHFYLIPLRQGLSLNLELDYQLAWPMVLLYAPSHYHHCGYRHVKPAGFLCGYWGFELRSLCLYSNLFCWAISWTPQRHLVRWWSLLIIELMQTRNFRQVTFHEWQLKTLC